MKKTVIGIIAVFVLIVFVSGCSNQGITDEEIKSAASDCLAFKGINVLSSDIYYVEMENISKDEKKVLVFAKSGKSYKNMTVNESTTNTYVKFGPLQKGEAYIGFYGIEGPIEISVLEMTVKSSNSDNPYINYNFLGSYTLYPDKRYEWKNGTFINL